MNKKAAIKKLEEAIVNNQIAHILAKDAQLSCTDTDELVKLMVISAIISKHIDTLKSVLEDLK